VCAVSENIMEAFDMVDTLSKSAQIYLAAKAMGFDPEGTSREDMEKLIGNFGSKNFPVYFNKIHNQ
jgi:rhamnulose-1-phosphate aldolase